MYKAYCVICTEEHEIDGHIFETGQIEWQDETVRPILDDLYYWRIATDKEVEEWKNS